MPRLFVAVRIAALPRLAAVLERLRPLRGVKAVSPENLHYTIRFLGDVDADVSTRLRGLLDGSMVDVRRFTTTIEGTSAFPSPTRPRVVWAGCDEAGATRLGQVADAVDRFADEVGLGPRDKPFVPHLTLARIKKPGGRGADEVPRAIREEAHTRYGAVDVDRVTLVHSTLTPAGPVYDDVVEVPLR